MSKDEHFGFFFSGVVTCVAVHYFWSENYTLGLLLGGAAIVIATFAIFSPRKLHPFNKLWMRIGTALSKVFNPIALGIIFFLIITPTAVILRSMGRDELGLKTKPQESYWIPKDLDRISLESLRRQF